MRKISIATDNGLELEISPGSHVFYKNDDGSETYWDWQEIEGQHEKLEKIYDQSLQSLENIKSIVPEK